MKITGVLHMHSEHSYDAKLPLSELRALLLEKGVSFACMTEHTDELTREKADAFVRDCRTHSDEQFVFVPGFEVPYKKTHVLMIGATDFVCDFARDANALRAWTSRAPLVVLAHPVRNNFEIDKTLEDVIDGVEIWNQQYDGKKVPRTRSVSLLADLRAENSELIATGGLDFHRVEHLGAPTISIRVSNRTEAAIVDALTHTPFTFGTKDHTFNSRGALRLTATEVLQSRMSTSIIAVGKRTNATLAVCGLSLPKKLKQRIRATI